MNPPVFSVIIITYNQEAYISQTLDSILQQNGVWSYEVIVGDDGSTDGTRDILRAYAEKYPDIVYPIFNEKNLGIIRNYFNVASLCRGRYMMQCAGDDYWLPGKVESQISFLESNPEVGMVYAQAYNFYENVDQNFDNQHDIWGGHSTKFSKLIKNNTVPAASAVFRRELFNQYLDEVKPLSKDWLMEDFPQWLWYSLRSRIAFIKEPMVVYRVLENSASHEVNLDKKLKFQHSFADIRHYFYRLAGYHRDERNLKSEKNRWIAHNLWEVGKRTDSIRQLKMARPIGLRDIYYIIRYSLFSMMK